MCTAISDSGIFGRTLDYHISFGEGIVVLPRKQKLEFLYEMPSACHAAILGMGIVREGRALLFDGVNEHGVFMAALKFPRSAKYNSRRCGVYNLASFELIPWVLSKSKSAKEAAALLECCCVMNDDFSAELPSGGLHWFIADKKSSHTAEAVEGGMRVYENSIGVLTNEPDFPCQLANLSGYLSLSPMPPEKNHIAGAELVPRSHGTGALGLPGDFSSPSRFARAAFIKSNTMPETERCYEAAEKSGELCSQNETPKNQIERFFRIADAVSVPRGCMRTERGEPICTLYTSCATPAAEYYYTTYLERTPQRVCLFDYDLEGEHGECTPLA